MPGPANLGSRIGSAFIEIGASFVGFGQGLAADLSNALLAQGYIVGEALESFGQAVFTKFSLPLAAATATNIAQFQALDREIRTTLTLFGTAPSLVRDTFQEMSAGVNQVSKDVGGLERDIADGLYQAISAGVPRGGVFDFLEVAQMAAIADRTADLTTAVDGLTTVVNAFGLEASSAGEAADVMFQTVALGKTTFGELSQDIGRVAPLAANAGVSFQELFAIVGALTLQGLKTSEAISFLRASITGLLRPTEELNAVFEEAGFASGEAAVPVIGLQAAFQTVFDAVGGSTSKLQELIGTSEGVSAILGVTGDNAANFARIMDSVENSTGAAERAFGIMDQSVGRTFGKLTESFDRLGNLFGEMASQFVVPAVQAITEVVTSMAGVFDNFRPVAEGLGTVLGAVFQVFKVPVVREIVGVFVSLGTAFYGLIGAAGLLALTLGKVLKAGLALKSVGFVLTRLQGVINIVQGGMAVAAARSLTFGQNLAKAAGNATILSRVSTNAGRALGFLSTNVTRAALATAGILAALVAATAAIGAYVRAQRDAVESQDTFGKSADALAESLGLVNQEFTLPGIDEGKSRLQAFKEQNLDLIIDIRNIAEELGRLAASDVLEGLAIDLVWKGNSPEDVLAELDLLEDATGIAINLDLGDLQDTTTQLEQFAEAVLVTGEFLGTQTKGLTPAANRAAQAISTLFTAAAATGDREQFVKVFNAVVDSLDDSTGQATALALALDKVFEGRGANLLNEFLSIPKGDLFGDITDVLDPERFIEILDEAGLSFAEIEIPVKPTLPEGFDIQKDLAFATEGFGLGEGLFTPITSEDLENYQKFARQFGLDLPQVIALGEEGRDAYADIMGGIEGVFNTARTQVQAALGDIRSSLEAQNPLLDVYSGKIKQSFAEWKAGQDQFQQDVQAVTDVRKRLEESNLPSAIIDQFDKQPLSKQVWLASLKPDQLELALTELQESFELISSETTERQLDSIDRIMGDVQGGINAGYANLQNDALIAGPIVANNFNREFDKNAAQWVTTANTWMETLRRILNQDLGGPSVSLGLPAFTTGGGSGGGPGSGTGGGNQFTWNFETAPNDITGEMERALAVLETSGLLETTPTAG